MAGAMEATREGGTATRPAPPAPSERARPRVELPALLRRAAPVVGPAAAVLALQVVAFPGPARVYVSGLVFGLLASLVAVGLALVYRANRIISFAQADLGTVPTVLAIGIVSFSGWSWWWGLGAGLLASLLLGVVVEVVLVRRFFAAPRLILTVATIGIAQLLAVAALLTPRMWGEDLVTQRLEPPFDASFQVGEVFYGSGSILALVVAPIALVAVGVFLRATAVGTAIRASAERADRASMLGIPVRALHTLVWAVAALLSFTGVFLLTNVVPLPLVEGASLSVLFIPIAALVLGRADHLPAIVAAAVALGILQEGVVASTGGQGLTYPVLAGVVLVAMLVRRGVDARGGRVQAGAVSTWSATDEVRPVPRELRRVPEVAAARWGGLAVLAIVAVALPGWLGAGDLARASTVLVFCLIVLSLVVLTGWAGQVSLGQMSFVGVGAAVGALATVEWELDLAVGLVVAGIAGALVATLVGLPALRLRGIYLAVTTLAFSLATSNYLLVRRHQSWIPVTPVERRPVLGTFDVATERGMYLLCLVVLVLALLAVHGLRRSRTGRAMVAVRDNERGAAAFGISPARLTLGAFATSGFLAAVAGCLLVHLVGSFDEATYGTEDSVLVFTAAVVGGLGSLVGAVLGAVYLRGADWVLPSQAEAGETLGLLFDLLPTALGVLVVLLVFPGGLGGLVYRWRDVWLRSVGRREGIILPGLAGEPPPDDDVLGGALAAERDVEALLAEAAPSTGAEPSEGDG